MEAQDTSRYPRLAEANTKQAYLGQSLVESAAPSVPAGVSAGAGELANSRVWNILATMLAGGALGRLGLGATRLATSPGSGFEPSPSSQMVSMRQPGEDEEEKYSSLRDDNDGAVTKQAYELPEWAQELPQSLTKGLFDMPASARGKSIPESLWRFLQGSQATTPSEIPLFWPAAGLAAAGGLAGGYGVTDKLLDSRRDAETESQLSKAKKRYLASMSPIEKMGKATLDSALDELADMCLDSGTEKQAAGIWGPAGVGGGGLLAYALLSALAAGKLTHGYVKDRGQASISEEALRRRSKERAGGVAPLQFSPESPQVA